MKSGHVTRLLEESGWLSGLALRLVNDPSLADDLAQETLLSALKANRQPDAESTRGWLATILRRKVLGLKREEARRGYRQEVAAKHEALPSAEEVGAMLESERLLRDALEGLEEPYRRAVMLRYREGLSAAEIARRDGEPAGTVRSRVRTGLEMLRSQLKERDHAWAVALLPLASLPSASARLALKTAGATSTTTGTYVMAAAAAALVGVPLAWNLLDSPSAPAITPVSNATVDSFAPNGASSVAHAAAPTPPKRVKLDAISERTADPAPTLEVKEGLVPGIVELTVVDGEGNPISGAYAQRWDNDHQERYSEESGADGRLEISPPTQRRAIQEVMTLVRAPGWGAAKEALVFRAGTESRHADVVLAPAQRVRGTVHDPLGGRNQLLVSFAMPLPEQLKTQIQQGVGLRDLAGQLEDIEFFGAFEAVNRDTGEFELNDVPERSRGQVIVLNDDDGGRIGWSEVLELEGGPTIDLDPIVLIAPTPKGSPVATASDAKAPDHAEAGSVLPANIEVVDASGQPCDSFEAQLIQHYHADASTQKPYSTARGANGRASITPLPFAWRLRIVAGDELAELGPFEDDSYSGPSEIQLAPSVIYRGSVQRGSQALAGARIELRQRSAPGSHFRTGELLTRAKPGPVLASVLTDSQGAFEFPRRLTGEYAVAVLSGNGPCAVFEVDAEHKLDLAVPDVGSLSGIVEAKFGELDGGVVTVSNELGLRESVTFGSDGRFRFGGLPEGLWRLGETYWSYEKEWLGQPNAAFEHQSRSGPQYFYMTEAEPSMSQRPGIDVYVTGGETADVRLPVQTTEPVRLLGTVTIDGRTPIEKNVHFQREPRRLDQSLIDQRWLRVSRKGQFDVTLPSHGKWRIHSPWGAFGSSYWTEFNVPEGSSPDPLEVNFETGTLILSGISPDVPFRIAVKGKSTPRSTSGAHRPFVTVGGSRQTLPLVLAGEVQILPVGEDASPRPLKTGFLEPGGTLELDLSR